MQRCGIGYDVHRFAEGRPLILGGVEIPADRGLIGHSDADALCHAIADAILGALGDHDIGFYFPPGDESIEGISSLEILREIRRIAERKSAWIHNIDSTVIAEAPKIMPHAPAMKSAIAEA
ncbi:MAG: 2-C-methyl-D-erythritol 2,4-cyclodiphosphate synthase, partial [Verrucomicrobiae bacterium]|nr:2-C-methyl-D-erythritol 2,4-cyclodiphosphate synthase [Verrucomicrobiae bacterium]